MNRQIKRVAFFSYILFRFANGIVLLCLDEKKYKFVDNFQIFFNKFFSFFFYNFECSLYVRFCLLFLDKIWILFKITKVREVPPKKMQL